VRRSCRARLRLHNFGATTATVKTMLRLNSQVLGLSRVRSNVRWSAATPLYYMPLSVFSLLERWGCLDAGAWRFHQKGHNSGGRGVSSRNRYAEEVTR